MKTHCLGLLFLVYSSLSAQVSDNFDDSDLLVNPKWTGQLSSFNTLNKELHSNNNVLNSVFALSTPSASAVNSEWLLDTRLLFNTSSLNYVDIVVMADSADVTKMKNGYFVRMGGTTDEISLYKTKNGTDTKIIDGADNVLNSSNNQWRILLTRMYSGNFILKRQLIGGTLLVNEGMAMDSDIVNSAYYGLRIKQSTASFFGKHYFDNLYAGKIIKDTIAPVWDSLVIVNKNQLRCSFNETCDSLSLTDPLAFEIVQGKINPISATSISDRQVMLTFLNTFPPNIILDLKIQGITDKTGNKSLPVIKPFYYSKPDTAGYRELLITELMPDPDPVVGLVNREYVELHNVSGKFIQLKGCKIHDPSTQKALPDMVLFPDSIIVLTSLPSLNNTGDRIWITNQRDEIIHVVNYTDGWYKENKKMNGGWSLEMINETNICAGANNWRASINPKGGTPGAVNSVKGIGAADKKPPVILSVLPLNDFILRITFDEEIDSVNSIHATLAVDGILRNFKMLKMADDFLSGDWQIDFGHSPDSAYRLEVSGISDCSGNLIAGSYLMLQWPSESKRNELIFNEILFNPKSGGYDYIEIYNNSSKAFDLSKHFIAVLDEHHQYKSIDKFSNSPLFIFPHQYLLLTADTLNVCESFNCKGQATIKFEYNKMPSMPDNEGNLLLINLNGKITDSLRYSEDWHFPLLSDKEGVSLERISFNPITRMADNWHSAASIAGFGTPGYINSQCISTNTSMQYFSLQNKTVSPDEDGFEDVLLLNYKLPDPNFTASINIYDTEGRLIRQWVNNETLGQEGFIAWNGTDYNSQKAGMGMYILDIECTNTDGSRIREKMSFTVAGKF